MKHSNCIDCGEVILAKAKRCRPCNFKHRKTTNKGIINFKCAVCGNTFMKVDRGNAYNIKRVHCSSNCTHAHLSYSKSKDKLTRKQHSIARNRARAYMSKFGIASTKCPEIMEVLVQSYTMRETINQWRKNNGNIHSKS